MSTDTIPFIVLETPAGTFRAAMRPMATADRPTPYEWQGEFNDRATAEKAAKYHFEWVAPPGFDDQSHLAGFSSGLQHNLAQRRPPLLHAAEMRRRYGNPGMGQYL